MSWAIGGLTAGFILLSGLVLLLVLKTGLKAGFKLAAVVVLSLFYWVQYHALQRYAGWPAVEPLPDEFVLIASEIIEPDPTSGQPGRMYWWIRESSDAARPPRVYQLPYRKETHQQSSEVLEAQKQGGQFVGRQSSDRHGEENLGISFDQITKPERYRKK